MAGQEFSKFSVIVAVLAVFLLYKFIKFQYERLVGHPESPEFYIADSNPFYDALRCLLTWE